MCYGISTWFGYVGNIPIFSTSKPVHHYISSSPREAYCQKPYSVVPTPIFRAGKQQATVRKNNKFIKYVREAAACRRIATLKNILIFVTCADEIPILGFAKQPFISFHEFSIPEIERKEKAQDDQVSV